ncbi:hypothetical protein ACTXMW_10345 [Brachybacterium paraconglomeratum]|uniref:hypothetical protein n=1 Tax=Brachybacterium paraconglomeratum TaxID=173362 RepID=UPI003FD1CE7E
MAYQTTRLLLKGLAAVAVASLGAPPGMVEFVHLTGTMAERLLDKNHATRELRKTVIEGLDHWAASENLQDDLAPGLEIARQALARHGLHPSTLRGMSFDADRITASIVEVARRTDRDWGAFDGDDADGAHAVARHAIATTVAVLLRERHRIESEVLPVLARELESLDSALTALRRDMNSSNAEIRSLTEELTSTASVADLRLYLETRIADWDLAGWIQTETAGIRHPSQIERELVVEDKESESVLLPVSEALRRHTHLVILGAPGAGKSWLARRIAREAAQSALEELDHGTDPLDIEIPLLTTWAAWTNGSSSTAREALIEASFTAGLGHSDLGGARRTDRIARLLGSTNRAFAILDALDEAPENGDVESRLHELHHIGGWRSVVTSRPSAWSAKRATRERRVGVTSLEPMRWERDIPAFIRAWFYNDRARAEALIGHLSRSDHLRRSSTIPLVLSFYCLFAQSSPPDAPLPTTDHELFDHVIHQMLIAEWSSGGRPSSADVATAERLLTGWAWHMAKSTDQKSGLGGWGDRTYPTDTASTTVRRILDNIAPVSFDSSGREFRSFRHRTLLEHFVAKHISELPTEAAAKELVPHLWFDPDWEVVAPRAIALHPERDRLRSLLLAASSQCSESAVTKYAAEELDRLWLRVAAETAPPDWNLAHREQLHSLRRRGALKMPDLVARSFDWTLSNAAIRETLEEALIASAEEGRHLSGDLLSALHLLSEDDDIRHLELTALMTEMKNAEFIDESDLSVFSALNPSPEEHTQFRRMISASLHERTPWGVACAARVLQALDPTPEEQLSARRVILMALTESDASTTAELADALGKLRPTEDDLAAARNEICRVLTTTSPWQGCSLLDLDPSDPAHAIAVLTEDSRTVIALATHLAEFRPTPAERLVAVLARTLAVAGERSDDPLVVPESLAELSSTREERLIFRRTVASVLSVVDSWAVPALLTALRTLDPTPSDRHIALEAIGRSLTEEGAWSTSSIIDSFHLLRPSAEESDALRLTLLRTIDDGTPAAVCTAAGALARLQPTTAESETALSALIAIMSTEDGPLIRSAIRALNHLDLDLGARRRLCRAMSRAAMTAGAGTTVALASEISRLQPTDEDRRTAISAVCAASASDQARSSMGLPGLQSVLSELITTDSERELAVTALSRRLTAGGRMGCVSPAEALLQISRTVDQRRRGFDAVLEVTARALSGDLPHLAGVLRSIADTPAQRRKLFAAIVTALGRAEPRDARRLTRLLRELSTFEEWTLLLVGRRR